MKNSNQDGYLDFVTQEALRIHNKLFMLDTGEGNDFDYAEKGWDVEELSGWLIAPEQRDRFILCRRNGTEDEYFEDDRVWVNWSFENNNLSVSFCRL